MGSLYIVVAILIFGVLIAVHEFGHFIVAKLCGVKVEEFSIGMGPALLSKQGEETLYSLRCIPVGGFCAMAGEDEESEDPRAFTSQKPWKRALILVAGSAMNLLLGFVIVLCLYWGAAGFTAPVIADFFEGCPYEGEATLQAGDRFYSIDGQRVRMYSDVPELLHAGDGVYDLVMLRDGKKVRLEDFELVTLEYEGQQNKMYGFAFGIDAPTVGNKIKYAWYNTLEFGSLVWEGLGQLISGNAGVKDMAGPVGVVDMMAESAEQAASVKDGLMDVFYFGAFIAVNLGLMNMLPIPALDGGRVFFLLVTWLIESITKKKLNPKYEGYIHAGGMALLMGLMVFIMFNDIIRIVTGQ